MLISGKENVDARFVLDIMVYGYKYPYTMIYAALGRSDYCYEVEN